MGYFKRERLYRSKMSKEEILSFLEDYHEPKRLISFGFGHSYTITTAANEFLILSRPKSGRGVYRGQHKGVFKNDAGDELLKITTNLKKTGVYFWGVLVLIFAIVMLVGAPDMYQSGERMASTLPNRILMILLMAGVCAFWFILFTEIYLSVAMRWMEKKLRLVRV